MGCIQARRRARLGDGSVFWSAARRPWKHCLRRVGAIARQALEALQPDPRARNRRLGHAAQFRPDDEIGGAPTGGADHGRRGEAHHLPGVHRGRSRRAAPPGAGDPRLVFQPALRGIPAAHAVKPEQRLHFGVPGTRSDSPVPRRGQARAVSGGAHAGRVKREPSLGDYPPSKGCPAFLRQPDESAILPPTQMKIVGR